MTAKEALSFSARQEQEVLTEAEQVEILGYETVHYLGKPEDKIKAHLVKMAPDESGKMIPNATQIERLELMNVFNYGYDDENGEMKTTKGAHIAFRYEVLDMVGSGSFGQALKCFDHKLKRVCALKVVRNNKKFSYQTGMELKILLHLNSRDPTDQHNIVRVWDYFLFRQHMVIVFELLHLNLYDFLKQNEFKGLSLDLIRRFAIQILQALAFQAEHDLVHCDLKPENILLKAENKSGIKVIDYGSSCFIG